MHPSAEELENILKDACRLSEKLLSKGIDVNGVGNDRLNLFRIAHGCAIFFPLDENDCRDAGSEDDTRTILKRGKN
jgi:hypothetical protein